jgi:hypothetical protein
MNLLPAVDFESRRRSRLPPRVLTISVQSFEIDADS